MATNFHRTFVNDRSFIRGAARLLVAPITQTMPAQISDVIALAAVTGTSDVQTFTATGPPTAGTFTITKDGQTTTPIVFNASAAAIQSALQALTTIGTGNVTCTGGPINTTPVVATFAAAMANATETLMTVSNTGLTGGTVAVAHTTVGTPAYSLYDAKSGWTDLGATKNGITIAINNTEETFDIDQQLGIISSAPTAWTVTVGTSLAESTPDRMQVAWQGSLITIDNTPTIPEQEFGVGAPAFYTQRRLAVLYQRPSGLIRAYFFRIVQRAPAESSLVHNKTGEQQSIPVSFNCLPDTTVTDVLKQFFIIRDQATS